MDTDPQQAGVGAAERIGSVTTLLVDTGISGLDRSELAAWSDRLLAEEASGYDSLTVRLSDEEAMRGLNRQFRQRDKPTDVLSFPGDTSPEGRHLGDVVIALPVAARQASARGHSLMREVKLLLLHGVLHCLGYDHEKDNGEMQELENGLRSRWIEADE